MNRNICWLVAAAIMMYLLFVASPMYPGDFKNGAQKLVENKTETLKRDCQKDKNLFCEQFYIGLITQLQKANAEIQQRLNQETEWFKLKYYVVGVLLLGFLVNAYLKNNDSNGDIIAEQFDRALGSFVTSFILSLTTTVAVSIDMQIRAGRIVINQLGSWIGYYVEPMLLDAGKDDKVFGWEQFLRMDGGYHVNTIFTLTFWTNIYFLSIFLYVLYLVVTRKALLQTNDNNKTIIFVGFWMLHITLLIGAMSNHIVPFTFQVTLFPLLTGWWQIFNVNPAWLILVYSVFWAFLMIVAYRYINEREMVPNENI